MMPHLQHISVNIQPLFHDCVFTRRFRIPCEKEGGRAKINPHDDGHIIEIVILLTRAEHGHLSAITLVGLPGAAAITLAPEALTACKKFSYIFVVGVFFCASRGMMTFETGIFSKISAMLPIWSECGCVAIT